MEYSIMTASALAELIGGRLRQYRLNDNKSQEELAEVTGLTRQKVARAENGKATLETVMALLIALEITNHLDTFLPPITISPIQLAKLKGKERVRASRSREQKENLTPPEEDLGW